MIKGALKSLRQFLAIESPFKMMKNAFSFSRYLNFCLHFLLMQKKRLHKKEKVNLKIYDVTAWLTNNYNTHNAQYRKKQRQPGNETWSVNRI